MHSLFLLTPLGLALLAAADAAFSCPTRTRQFDDLDAPAWRVVMDDDRAPPGSDEQTGDDDK
jgi:cbb3-type cytochrome oxidase maturation protein